MKKLKVKVVNKIYLIFLIIILIIAMSFSFKTGMQLYYLINTNLNDKDTPVNSEIAGWNFEVTIEY